MADDNPKYLRPKSTSGGIRKMQARETRELQMEWNGKHLPPSPADRPQGVYVSCSCGNSRFVEGDPVELVERRFRCRCGKLI